MNKFFCFSLLVIFLASCSGRPGETGKKVITVSILPQKTFVQKIAGDEYKINVLIPPGASPATYSLLPSQTADITRSAVWFRIGHIGFEYSWKNNITGANPAMKVIDLSEGLDLIRQVKTEEGEGNAGYDPHTWLSPACVRTMAGKIRDVLSELNPQQAQVYKINYLKFEREIDQLDIQLNNLFSGMERKKIITYHPSLSYLARDYGLHQFSLEPGGKEPTPRTMAEVMKLAKSEGIKVIYIQGEIDKSHAEVFAAETGGRIIQVAPLSPDWSENLLLMAKTLKDNL